MKKIRQSIAEYLKYIYDNETISTQDAELTYAVDESLIANINNSSKWLVGVINTTNRNYFRCNLTSVRNTDYLRRFITTYIEPGNTIISDGWQGYNWLNDANSGFNHLTFIHGQGQWGVVFNQLHILRVSGLLSKII